MPSSFTSRLKLERQASGENSGTWGNLVNYVLNRVDASVSGYQSVSVAGSANVTLTSNNSTSNTDDSTTDDQVHNKVLELTGALGADIHVFTDAVEQNYILFNNTTGSQTLTFANTGHAANGVALKQGAKTLVYSDGSSVTDVMADLGDINVTGIANTGSSTYFALPSADGTSGQALVTNGSGQLSFDNAGISTGKAIAMAIVFG
jgi:cytoskeletal protein RodZ